MKARVNKNGDVVLTPENEAEHAILHTTEYACVEEDFESKFNDAWASANKYQSYIFPIHGDDQTAIVSNIEDMFNIKYKWSEIPKEFNWASVGSDGSVYAHKVRPVAKKIPVDFTYWSTPLKSDMKRIDDSIAFDSAKNNPENSLEYRPRIC